MNYISCLLLLLLAVRASAAPPVFDTIGAERLLAWLDSADPPLVLDVRGRQAYLAGTLPGAFGAGSDPKGYLPEHSGDPVVLLTPDRLDAGLLAAWTARLADAGHPVWLLTGGMAAWTEAGGSIERPDAAYAQPGRVPFLIPRGLCEGGEPSQVFE